MKLNNKTLEDWLKNPPSSSFNNGKKKDYYSSYKAFKDRVEPIHLEVTAGANLKNSELFLNDHGPKHIETVIERVTILIKGSQCELNAKEVYFLLIAIQIHDLGNMLGRYNHEKNAISVLSELICLVGEDAVEQRMIRRIAEAHGGKILNTSDKDKITKLDPLTDTLGVEIRMQLLASLLRFADELADDKTRCNSQLLKKLLLPKGSEVYHAYAYCLDSVIVKHSTRQIELKFKIPQGFALRKFGKWDNNCNKIQKIFLIDEIYERVLKMHFERIYTMRFIRDFINLESILVLIEFYADVDDERNENFAPISFEIKEIGYPNFSQSIYHLCPSLTTANDNRIDGKFVSKGGMKVAKS